MSHLILKLLVVASLAPLASFLAIVFLGRWLGQQRSALLATTVMGGSFALSATALMQWLGSKPGTLLWTVPWIPLGGGKWLYLGALVDDLTVAMMAMVSLIAFLVHVYSMGYMHGDPRFGRFFAYLSFFTFTMFGIVLSNSIMQLFVFWELVGLASYLLIGFWFEKRGPQLACKKAFVLNRVGDAGFLVGFGILFYKLAGNLLLPAAEGLVVDGQPVVSLLGELQKVLAAEGHSITDPPAWLTLAGIGLFCGAIGKSAQFPLHTWLPDAMEGPTPVSSIVHSATMVAAGVYLTGRIYPILTPEAHLFIATLGLITLVMAALMALVMTDIKRVLAYSTLSQLGYMILGLGVGSWGFALYHLITHAFFKCCLFQCSGSVIHAAHHQQDMRYYGGLKSKMPVTALCYFICTLAIAGASIPWTEVGLSGFYSKDGIIAGAVNYGHALHGLGWWANLFWIGPVVIAYLTPFYMARSFALTFLGTPRDQHLHDHAHEAPPAMLIPQVVLATLAVVSGWFLWKGMILNAEPGVEWVQKISIVEPSHGMHATHAYLLHGLAWILTIGGGIAIYSQGFTIAQRIVAIPPLSALHTWASNKFYFDGLYDGLIVWLGKVFSIVVAAFDKWLVDGVVNLVGYLTKWTSDLTGKVDLGVVDGAVNGAADFAWRSGELLRATQAGRVRAYVLMLFSAATLVTLVVMTVVLAGH